jgi:hypothetical protein
MRQDNLNGEQINAAAHLPRPTVSPCPSRCALPASNHGRWSAPGSVRTVREIAPSTRRLECAPCDAMPAEPRRSWQRPSVPSAATSSRCETGSANRFLWPTARAATRTIRRTCSRASGAARRWYLKKPGRGTPIASSGSPPVRSRSRCCSASSPVIQAKSTTLAHGRRISQGRKPLLRRIRSFASRPSRPARPARPSRRRALPMPARPSALARRSSPTSRRPRPCRRRRARRASGARLRRGSAWSRGSG